MIKKIAIILAMVASLFAVTVPAQAAPAPTSVSSGTISPNATQQPGGGSANGYKCYMHTRHLPLTTRRVSGYAYDAYWYVNGLIDYLVCSKPGHRKYSLPINTTGKYNRSGSHQFCNKYWPNLVFDYMTVNANFSDAWPDNPNFNPKEFHVPCDNDTVRARAQLYRTPHKLYWRNGSPPHYSVKWGLHFHGKWTPHPNSMWSGLLR